MACELYAQALNRHARFRVVGHATTARSTIELSKQNKLDVALIGLGLEDGPNSGLDALKEVRATQPDVKSIILVDRSKIDLVITAFRAGARGVFDPSQDAFNRLCRCIDKVSAGQIWATSEELVQVLDALIQPNVTQILSAQGIPLLTKRELDVARLVGEGLTNRLIASELHLSENTVRNNLFRIFNKLGISSRVELTLRTSKHAECSTCMFARTLTARPDASLRSLPLPKID